VTDTCPIRPDSSAHKLESYLQESDSPSSSDHRSTDDTLSYGSDAPPRNHAAALRSK
jgi:hypothetical protein